MPKNLFTAGFIGTPQMNFFPAKLSIVKNEFAVRILDNVISVPDQMQKALEVQNAGKDIILGVRPEHIEIADDDSANSISAEIDFLERMGSEIYLHVKAGGNNATLRMPSKASRHVYGKERESIINITFCKNKIHLFDAETEENLQNLSNF